jgi:hypothetical protein
LNCACHQSAKDLSLRGIGRHLSLYVTTLDFQHLGESLGGSLLLNIPFSEAPNLRRKLKLWGASHASLQFRSGKSPLGAEYRSLGARLGMNSLGKYSFACH